MPILNMHDYQTYALRWLLQRLIIDRNDGCGLLLDPGLGKTCITLAIIKYLKIVLPGTRVLIVAPLRVVYSVWPQERDHWDQFTSIRMNIIHGSPAKRREALEIPADIYLINPEGITWLADELKGKPFPFTFLVVDESDKFKSWGSKRTKALRKMLPNFPKRIILTGTPSPNSIEDLFSQIYILDSGDSLGTGISKFRTRYFYRGGYGGYKWIPHQNAQKLIEKKISPMCLRMAAEDHLDMPELLIHDVWVELPPKIRKDYKKLEREMFLALAKDGSITPTNAGAKYILCRQMANGGVYLDDEMVHLHQAKIDAVGDLVGELQGKPVLIAFQFRHDLARLRKIFPGIPSIDGRCKPKEATELIDQWNAGQLPQLAVQPQSLSHGVNLQSGPGRDIIWVGLSDSLTTYLQLNARIYRQGATGQVRIHRVLTRSTVDVAIRERIESKRADQSALLEAIDNYRREQEKCNNPTT